MGIHIAPLTSSQNGFLCSTCAGQNIKIETGVSCGHTGVEMNYLLEQNRMPLDRLCNFNGAVS